MLCGPAVGDVVVDRARREVVDEPWFLVVLVGVVVGLLVVVSCVIIAILYQRHVSRDRKSSKQPVIDGQSESDSVLHLRLPCTLVAKTFSPFIARRGRFSATLHRRCRRYFQRKSTNKNVFLCEVV